MYLNTCNCKITVLFTYHFYGLIEAAYVLVKFIHEFRRVPNDAWSVFMKTPAWSLKIVTTHFISLNFPFIFIIPYNNLHISSPTVM
jgi:hypothetical protein